MSNIYRSIYRSIYDSIYSNLIDQLTDNTVTHLGIPVTEMGLFVTHT